MKLSFNQTVGPNVRDDNGYGYAAKMTKQSLTALGHEISWRDKTADIEMNFIQPDHWYWSGVDYRIGYLPWESTDFHPGWVDKINNQCDEIWTPSPVVAQWMKDAGVKKEPHVYQHGVDDIWEVKPRTATGTFRVMHHGAEALRKNSQDVINTWFADFLDKDAILTLKCNLKDGNGYVDTDHCWIRNGRIPLERLLGIYYENQLMAYPSWGEGFGLAPLQALGTGMPILITRGWAPYEHLLPDEWISNTTLSQSPWQHIHPGKMWKPDIADFRDKLLWQFENREQATKEASVIAERVHAEYDWIKLTEEAFSHLKMA